MKVEIRKRARARIVSTQQAAIGHRGAINLAIHNGILSDRNRPTINTFIAGGKLSEIEIHGNVLDPVLSVLSEVGGDATSTIHYTRKVRLVHYLGSKKKFVSSRKCLSTCSDY